MSKFSIACEAVLVLFPGWLKRQLKIAALKVKLKTLEALQKQDHANLTEAVTETGRVRVHDEDGKEFVLEIKSERGEPKEARLGAKEIEDAIDTYDSGIRARYDKVVARALADKAKKNAAEAPMKHELVHRPADERDARVRALTAQT